LQRQLERARGARRYTLNRKSIASPSATARAVARLVPVICSAHLNALAIAGSSSEYQ
jgi:hypothetical protein